jgi:hypothetical protein
LGVAASRRLSGVHGRHASERFFALLAERALKRGAFRSVVISKMQSKLTSRLTMQTRKLFRWIKTADDILASIQRFCLRISYGKPIEETEVRIGPLN